MRILTTYNTFIKIVSVVLIMAIASLFSPVFAGWDDKSDELPGMASDNQVRSAVVTIIIVSVVCITAMIIPAVIIAKKKKLKAQSVPANEKNTGNSNSINNDTTEDSDNKTGEKRKIELKPIRFD